LHDPSGENIRISLLSLLEGAGGKKLPSEGTVAPFTLAPPCKERELVSGV
jgi:hypothetical protein